MHVHDVTAGVPFPAPVLHVSEIEGLHLVPDSQNINILSFVGGVAREGSWFLDSTKVSVCLGAF